MLICQRPSESEPYSTPALVDAPLALSNVSTTFVTRPLAGDTLRGLRAIGILESLGTPDAQRVLEAVAKGNPGALLTQDAKSALERLAMHTGRGR